MRILHVRDTLIMTRTPKLSQGMQQLHAQINIACLRSAAQAGYVYNVQACTELPAPAHTAHAERRAT